MTRNNQHTDITAAPRKYSITRIYWMGLVLLASVPALLLGYLWISDQYRSFHEQSAALRQSYLDTHKQFLQREVADALDYIDFKCSEIDPRLLFLLKQAVDGSVQTLVPPHPEKSAVELHRPSPRELKILDRVRFGGGSDHLFILDENGAALLFPIADTGAHRYEIDTPDAGGQRFLRILVERARTNGESSLAAWLPKPDGLPGAFSAQLYVRFIPALNIYIGAIGYVEDMVSVTQREVLARFRGQAHGDGLSMAIFDYEGKVLLAGYGGVGEGGSIRNLKDADGGLIAPRLLAAREHNDGELVSSHWRVVDSDNVRLRMDFARVYPSWRWVLTAGLDLGELDAVIEQQRDAMKLRVQQRIAYVGLIVVGLLLAATIIARRLAGQTRAALRQFYEFFAESNRQNTRIAVDQLPLIEFEQLALDANRMLDYRLGVERELTAARVVAENANKAKGQFLSTMSHELRTPLNGVLGYAQILMRDPLVTTEQHRHLSAIQSCGEHLLTLINDVLDLAKIESGELEIQNGVCRLYQLLENVGDIVRGRAEAKGLTFRLEISPQLADLVWLDEVKLRQILINLLGNAIKFTDSGGVTLTARADTAVDELIFEVSDTGVGIARERLLEIFQPFRQLHDHGGGTGLGLAISERVCTAMGGELSVDSALGAGSRFTLTLPLLRVEAELVAAPPKPVVRRQVITLGPDGLRVMVVDDNPSNRLVMAGLLGSVGIDIVEAEHGADALQRLRVQTVPLVLMDVRMPVMDGIEATRLIKQDPALRDLIVIAVSASVDPDVVAQMRAAGCDDFVSKPVQLTELLEKIALHLHLPLRDDFAVQNSGAIELDSWPVAALDNLCAALAEGDLEAMYAALAEAEREGVDLASVKRLRALLDNFEIETLRDVLAPRVERSV